MQHVIQSSGEGAGNIFGFGILSYLLFEDAAEARYLMSIFSNKGGSFFIAEEQPWAFPNRRKLESVEL